MKITNLLFLSAVLLASFAQAQDITPADEKIEDRMARIYKNFNQSEISDAEWSKIAGDKNADVYTLQSGDTLWDISEKFFGTGFYWPKIWQLNDKITNPHMIAAQNTLKFSPGSDVAPPSLGVDSKVEQKLTQSDDDSFDTEEVATVSEEKQMVVDKLTIPKGRKEVPPLKQIPDSFPEWREMVGNFDENGFARDSESRYAAVTDSNTFVSSVASSSGWAGVGKVDEMEGDLTTASTYQKIFVKLDAPAANGDVFTVFSNGLKIKDPENRDVVGKEVSLKGLITIHEPIQGAEDMYSAYVTRTVTPILTGDELIKGDVLVKAQYTTDGPQSNISSRILDGEKISRKNLIVHDIVYLDRGQKDGVQVGSVLDILKNYSIRNSKSKVKFDSQVIGRLKIVDVSDSISTAVLVSVKDKVLPGDETSGGVSTGDNPVTEPSDPAEAPESFE